MTITARPTPNAAPSRLNIRKSIDSLSAQELADFRRAIKQALALNDKRGFDYFASWHGVPFGWCQHHDPLFLPWHRAYLYWLELALQSQVPGVTLPWWDWSKDGTIPAAVATRVPATRPLSGSGVSLLLMAWEANTARRAPAAQEALTGPPSHRPADGPPPGAMSYRYTTDLAAVRAVVYRYARQAGLPESRAIDLVLAVSEVAANTVRHAKSPGSLKIWYDTREIVCEIQDDGIIADPLAGRRRPSLEAMGGHGLWIVNQVCDEVEMRSDETGTTIRLHMGLPPVKPGS